MAVIECVFNYNEKTKKITQVIHVMELDASDKINFVTDYPSLTLESKDDCRLLNLKKGDYAPVKYTESLPKTIKVPELKVYYHGPQGHFNCGEYDQAKKGFKAWAIGIDGPGGGSGPA